MDFKYAQRVYDKFTKNLYNSTFVINATVHIGGKQINYSSVYSDYTDNLDGRVMDSVQVDYPKDLLKFYRIKVFPLERVRFNANENNVEHDISGKFTPFDRWVSVQKSEIAVKDPNKTVLDYAENVEIQGNLFTIKGIVVEDFTNLPSVHIFLIKEDISS